MEQALQTNSSFKRMASQEEDTIEEEVNVMVEGRGGRNNHFEQ